MRASTTLTLLSGLGLGFALPQEIGGAFGFGDAAAMPGGAASIAPPAMEMNSLIEGGPDGGGMGRAVADTTGGSGPYKACFGSDESLPEHTIYAPKEVDPDMKLPLIVWGNGACASDGSAFANFLTEIASHGFMVIANGAPSRTCENPEITLAELVGQFTMEKRTTADMLTQSLDWALAGNGAEKWGVVDPENVGAAGQSCGGLEAYSASVNDTRVKVIGMFNSGVVNDSKRDMVKQITQPVGFFIGGDLDGAHANSEKDWVVFNPDLPVLKMNLQTGHMGTYFDLQGGKFGKAAVAWWQWQLKGDEEAKAKFFDPESELIKDGWQIETKNFD